ncbi:OmpH family outer membrane protein [bacterium]|nr:OmpH family outer membrane protein [bacterium]
MGIRNKIFPFIKSKLAYRCVTGNQTLLLSVMLRQSRQAKFLLSAIVLLIFFSVSIAVFSQEKPLVLNEENSTQVDAENKVGFADFLTIYHSYSQTKIEDERLKKAGSELQEKIDADRNKIIELEKRMDSGILSEKERENLSKEVEVLKTQITENIQGFNLKIDSDRRQIIDKLIEDLKVKLSNYGKEQGYAMIFDKNELIFSDTRLDVTQEIIDYINKNKNE